MHMQREIPTEVLRQRHQDIWCHSLPFQEQGNAGLALRTYRAIDWTHRARMEHSDSFAAYLFLWIAFEALYGTDPQDGTMTTRRAVRREFLEALVGVDQSRAVHGTLREVDSQSQRLLNNDVAYARWKGVGDRRKLAQMFAQHLLLGRTVEAAATVFDRLNTVRNWLVHGGIAWGSRIMTPAVADGTAILTRLVPTFVDVMLDSRDIHDWSVPAWTPDRYESRTSAKEIPAIGMPNLDR